MEQRDSTPLKHHSETAIPNMTTTQTSHFHETLRLCSETHHLSCMTYHFYANHNRIAVQTDTWHIHEKSLFRALPNGRAIGLGFEQLRTVEDGWGRLRTRKQRRANTALPSDSQVKREPFATHSGKNSTISKWKIGSQHTRTSQEWMYKSSMMSPRKQELSSLLLEGMWQHMCSFQHLPACHIEKKRSSNIFIDMTHK